jgi:phospholipid/cholesterol/gamma-HCH transport system substrate-binding protein
MIKEIMTGIFLSVIVALLIFFTIIISGVDLLHGRHTRVCEVRFVDVGALKVQDPVYVRGLKVGSVQALKLVPGAVMVRLTLDADVVLREDYSMTIGKTSMLGGTCLQINEGVSENVLPETVALNGVAPTDMMADLGELVNELRSAINAEELRATISNIQKASADFAVLTERIRKGEGTMGKLLSEDSKLYDDLMASLDNLKAVTSDLRSGKGLLGKLISEEDTTYEDLRATIANLNTVTGNLSECKGFLGKLMSEEDESYDDLKASLANIRLVTEKLNNPATGFGRLLSQESPLIADLEATAANLRLITERLEKGDGTLGKLVNDDAVAVELEAAIKDVRQIIDNMRDTAPITTFSSLFFGGL